jgi:hypothetical protein
MVHGKRQNSENLGLLDVYTVGKMRESMGGLWVAKFEHELPFIANMGRHMAAPSTRLRLSEMSRMSWCLV